jgi:hypothetical protein
MVALGFYSPAGYLSARQAQLTASRARTEKTHGSDHDGQAGGAKGPDRMAGSVARRIRAGGRRAQWLRRQRARLRDRQGPSLDHRLAPGSGHSTAVLDYFWTR